MAATCFDPRRSIKTLTKKVRSTKAKTGGSHIRCNGRAVVSDHKALEQPALWLGDIVNVRPLPGFSQAA